MEALRACIKTVFPSANVAALAPTSRLEDITDWDSMNGVNLMMELEAVTGVSLFEHGVVLEGHHTLNEVAQLIEQHRPTP